MAFNKYSLEKSQYSDTEGRSPTFVFRVGDRCHFVGFHPEFPLVIPNLRRHGRREGVVWD